jgi:hypothetical protein
MKKTIFFLLFISTTLLLNAQTSNKLVLRKASSGSFKKSQFNVVELPQQMMVNWYDASGFEHNDDKLLLYVIKDTLFFEMPKNDSLVEAIAFNQIESIKMFSVGKIFLKPVAVFIYFFFGYGVVGSGALFGAGLFSSRSAESSLYFAGGLFVAAIDVPLFFITKALWDGSNMRYKTEKWKLANP